MLCFLFFFKQKTAYEMRISDWSSDVCSSDLNDSIENKAGEHDDADRGDATLRADVLQQQSAGRQAEDRADPLDQAEHIDAGAHPASHPNHQRIEPSPHPSMPDAKRGHGDSKGPDAAPPRQVQPSDGRNPNANTHTGERVEATPRE